MNSQRDLTRTIEELFTILSPYPILFCRLCQSAVRTDQIVAHLRAAAHQRTIPFRIADQISQQISIRWPELQQSYTLRTITHPASGPPQPLALLPVFTDGLWCRRDPSCQYICRTTNALKIHWRQQHQWAARLNPTESTQAEITQYTESVSCQRLFRSGPGSYYFLVRASSTEEPEPEPSQIDSLFNSLESQHQQYFITSSRPVERTELDEASPWLRRTRWTSYLRGQSPEILHSLVESPVSDSSDPLWQICQALQNTARTSQQIAKHCGHLIRTEVVRTELHELPKTPLQAYMDPDAIHRHILPWQQIFCFFARVEGIRAEIACTGIVPDEPYPSYELSSRQRRSWNVLWRLAKDHARTTTAPLDPPTPFHYRDIELACIDFCLELLNQRINADEYECALVCALAVIGRSRTGWQTVEAYSPILSKIIKIARFIVLGRALWLDPHAEHIIQQFSGQLSYDNIYLISPLDNPEFHFAYDDEGYHSSPELSPSLLSHSNLSSPPPLRFSQNIRRRTTKTFQEWVKLMTKTLLVRGTNTPMQWMLDLRTYALKVSFNTTQPGHVGWLGPDRLLYKHLSLTIGDLRGWVHGLTATLNQQLSSELLLLAADQPPPTIPWATLTDDPSEQSPGWSFLQDSRTLWPVRGDRWLIDRLRCEPALRRRFLDSQCTQFRTSAIQRYLRQVVRFRERLSVLIHLCAGQPGRAPELLSVRHRNTENSSRNIFIEDQLVVLAVRYHKGFHVSNDIKIIHRYLPREIGSLVVRYLWLVLPLAERLDALRHPDPTKFTSARTALLWSPDPQTDRPWSSERFRDVLQRESKIGLHGQALNIASWREIAIAISRRFLRTSSAFSGSDYDPSHSDETPDDESEETYQDLQSGHSAHIAGVVYAREMQEAPGTIAFRRTIFRNISQDWHQFLGFPAESPAVVRERQKRKRAPWETEQEENQFQRRYQLATAEPEQALQHFMGDSLVRFRSKQKEAFQAIQRGDSPVVAVLPTGAGKTLLFLLPAWVSKGLTVVVVPLIALRTEFYERCIQMGISCAVWDSERPPDEASILLVTPESALTTSFRTFLLRQQTLCRLDRIVIDECHQIISPSAQFRPHLAHLGRLQQLNVQMVFLTATLPPTLEPSFWKRLGHPAADISLYRARTTRSNIAYRSYRPNRDPADLSIDEWTRSPDVVRLIQDRCNRAGDHRVLVYATTIRQAQALAELLDCEAFYGKQIDKEGILSRFRRTKGALLVATSALGMGIDIPDIRTILHLGWPWGLLDYAQETGRAGRDGLPSEAILIQPRTMLTAPPWIHAPPQGYPVAESDLVQEWLDPTSQVCRRQLLDQYLDNHSRTKCEDGEEPCEVCSPGWSSEGSSGVSPSSTPSDSFLPDHQVAPPDDDLSLPSPPVVRDPLPLSYDYDYFVDETIDPVYRRSSPPPPPLATSQPQSLTPALPPEARFALRQQDIRRTTHTVSHFTTRQEQTAALADIEEEISTWQQRCWVCTVNQDPDDHELIDCTSPQSLRAREWYSEYRTRFRFASFSCCFGCYLPQDLCTGLVDRIPCQYPHVLMPMVAMMLYGEVRTDRVHRILYEIRQAWYHALGVEIESEDALVRVLGETAPTSLRQSRLCETFLYLRQQLRPSLETLL